jgi:hypothetical protein
VDFTGFVPPPGCTSSTCKIAFDWRGNSRLLLIDQGIRYSGNYAVLSEFVVRGEHTESTAEEMRRFIADIRQTYDPAQTPQSSTRINSVVDTAQISVTRQAPMRLNALVLQTDLQEEVIGQEVPAGVEAKVKLEAEKPMNLCGVAELSRQLAQWRSRRLFWRRFK